MRRLVVPFAAVAVLAAPAIAYASPDACPPGVAATQGTNPTYAEISGYLTQAASDHDVPVQVLRAIAYQESQWRQFENGTVLVSSDSVCGLGIMQVTADGRDDAAQLASDAAYNVQVGAGILHDKWVESQTTPPPTDYPADDPHALENWYYALCLYNGCSGSDTYAAKVAETVADPFRRVVVAGIKPYLPIGGFTKPSEAKSDYDFPDAFQARLSPHDFVFYDHTTGVVSAIVPAPTHDDRSAPPTIEYGPGTYGPDGPYVTCSVSCGGWRLAETRGIAGRAHWTLSQGTEGARVTWAPPLPRTGLYRVSAFVPDVAGAEPMGTATYHLGAATIAVDQPSSVGTWAALGDRSLVPGATVWVNDVSGVSGRRLVADAMRFAVLTKLDLTASTSTVTYGHAATLTARLTHLGTTTGLSGKAVKVYKRKAGVTAWTYVGRYVTNSAGAVAVPVAPSVNAEYQATFAAATADFVSSASVVRRINVRTRVAASLSRTTVPRNVAVTASTSVAPSHAGQTVILQRYYSGAWHNALSKTLNSSSAAAFTFSKSIAGTYTYRVYKPADADHVASWSVTLTLKVT